MRISTNTIFETATNQLGKLQTGLARTQMQLATNRRLLTAADDPIASARALEVSQSQSLNAQYATNRTSARASLSLVEESLNSTTQLLQDVQTLVVQAGNGTLSPANRAMLATEVEGKLNNLLGLANTSDGVGGFLFSGYRATTTPFLPTVAGAEYQGDQGVQALQVGSSRQMPISDSGAAVFENNRTGNGTFQTGAATGNTGSGTITVGVVTDRAQVNGHGYEVKFTLAGTPAATTYSVTDTSTTPADVVLADVPYESGKQIAFNGISFEVKGSPAHGDQFTVKPSKKESVFSTLTNLLATLRIQDTDPTARAALNNGLTTASANLTMALDNVLTVRASVGSRMKELDYLDSSGADIDIQYAATLSELQDLDLAEAISMFSQQQMTLEAAQKSFKSISGLSLFNYLG